jgi:hypothetical protein
MKRLLGLFVAVGVLCGCRGQSPPGSDPFFGRTAVPPPPTGSAAGRLPDPYYRAAPGAAAPLAPVPQVQQPGVSLPPASSGGGSRYDPPGGSFNYRGASASGQANPTSPAEKWLPQVASSDNTPSRIRIIEPENRPGPVNDTIQVAAVAANAKAGTAAGVAYTAGATAASGASRPASGDALAGSLSGRPRVVRPLQPRPGPAESTPGSTDSGSSATATAASLQRVEVPPKSVDIMDLPPAGSSRSAAEAKTSSIGGGVRLVSGSAAAGDPSGVVAAGGVSATEAAQDGSSASADR